jgi:hypothetical protein
LAEHLKQRLAWRAPKQKQKKEPFTLPMFDALKRPLTEKSGYMPKASSNFSVAGIQLL